MVYKISEIFYSVQGEGFFIGIPAIFIRFSGCNLNCDFCDTDHSMKEKMTEEQIIKRIRQYPAKHLVFTGGEPTLQIKPNKRGYNDFVRKLRDLGYYVQIETNGTYPIAKNFSWVTISPKTKISKKGNELKVVYLGKEQKIEKIKGFQHYYLQPCERNGESNYKETIAKAMEDGWRISIQLQKILNIK
jgi:7-carboxy-7-deazaguanine synthase